MGFLRSLLTSIASPETVEKPQPWLLAYANGLGGTARAPDHADEEGFIDGGSSDGIAWTLRVLNRTEPDGESPFDYHHVLWHSDTARRDDVVLVFGSDDRDAKMWVGLDGVTVRADQNMARLDAAFGELERLVEQTKSGALSDQEFVARLESMKDESPMSEFMKRAVPFALPHPLSAPWHALTTDPIAAARTLTPAVVARIEEWRSFSGRFEGWIRGWVGGPNVRLESRLVDPEPRGYRSLVEVGLALVRAARDIGLRGSARAWAMTIATVLAVPTMRVDAQAAPPRVGPATQGPSITQLQSRIASLEAQLQALERRVKKLEEDTLDLEDLTEEKTPKEIEGGQGPSSSSREIASLTKRVQKLEQDVAKSDDPKPLTVRGPFVVVDDRGRPMVRVEDQRLGPALEVFGKDGKFATLHGDALFMRSNSPSTGGVRIGLGQRGHGYLFLVRKGGQVAADLGYDQQSERLGLRLYANNQVTAELGLNATAPGAGFLKLGNGQGKVTGELSTNARNEMALRIRGNSDAVVAGLGIDPDGSGGGSLKLANKKGDVLASVAAQRDAGHVSVFGTDGKARANVGAEPNGNGFVRIGSTQIVEAASLTIAPLTGGGHLQLKDRNGIGVQLGPRQGNAGGVLGDLCVNSSKDGGKGMCFSVLAAKSMLPYF